MSFSNTSKPLASPQPHYYATPCHPTRFDDAPGARLRQKWICCVVASVTATLVLAFQSADFQSLLAVRLHSSQAASLSSHPSLVHSARSSLMELHAAPPLDLPKVPAALRQAEPPAEMKIEDGLLESVQASIRAEGQAIPDVLEAPPLKADKARKAEKAPVRSGKRPSEVSQKKPGEVSQNPFTPIKKWFQSRRPKPKPEVPEPEVEEPEGLTTQEAIQVFLLGSLPVFGTLGALKIYTQFFSPSQEEEEEEDDIGVMMGKEVKSRERWKPPSKKANKAKPRKPLDRNEAAGTAIIFDPNSKTFSLSSKSCTYAFRVNELNELEHLYWGAKLNPDEDLGLSMLNSRWAKQHIDWLPTVCGDPGEGSLHRNVYLREFADNGTGDYRRPSIILEHATGSNVSSLQYHSHRVMLGKPQPITPGMAHVNCDKVDDAQTLVIVLHDQLEGDQVELFFTVFSKTNAIVRKAIVTNRTDEPAIVPLTASPPKSTDNEEQDQETLDTEFDGFMSLGEPGDISIRDMERDARKVEGSSKMLHSLMSATSDFEAAEYGMDWHLTTLDGAYERERQKMVRKISNGTLSIGSRRGQSSHQHNPFMLLSKGIPQETTGECFAFNLVYSGNFLGEVEMTETGRVRLSMGLNPDTFKWYLPAGEQFETPEVVMLWSENGSGEISRELHRFYHQRLYKGLHANRRRPILVNTWEATYFAIEHKAVVNMARQADKLGIDLVVLDDGWFGQRNDDASSLGDWNIVNEAKLPFGLDGLAEAVRSNGTLFGLWMEPESISENSELYRQHPDWCIHTTGRERTKGRNQLLLDYGRPEVRQHIISVLSQILSLSDRDSGENLISYVKWDMNRCITEAGSPALPPERQGEVMHRHILGLYEVLHTITNRFPEVLFEGCAQGGGRLDPGILCFMPQVWCSDNTDFADRLRIQFGTSLAYPLSAATAHVSDVPNHQTGRYSSIRGRALLAMAGGIGWELDVRNIDDNTRRAAVAYNTYYRLIAPLILYGDLYRLWDPFADESRQAAWMMVNEGKTEAVAFAFIAWRKPYQFYPMLKMQGLDENAMYIVETVQPEEAMCSPEEYKMYQLKSMIMNPTPQVGKLVVEVVKNMGPGGVLRMGKAVDAIKQGDFGPLERILLDPGEYGVQVAYDALCEVEQNPEMYGLTMNHGAMRSLSGREMQGSTLMKLGIPIQFESDMDGLVVRMRKVGSKLPPVGEWQPTMDGGEDGKMDWLIPR